VTSRRAREIPLLLLLACAFATATAAHGWLAHRSFRQRLDAIVHDLGGSVAETAAAGLRSSLDVLGELERELEEALRQKAALLSQSEERSREDPASLERFAAAAGLKHVLVFSPEGALIAAARYVPSPGGGAGLDPGRLRLSLEDAARALAREAGEQLVVRELEVPGAGLKPSLAAAVRLRTGPVAVLVQDAEAFARVRAAAGGDAVARRLEEETRIAYVRFNLPVPEHGGEVLDVERRVASPRAPPGILRVGIELTPLREALAVQVRFSIISGALLAAVATAAAWGALRLRRAHEALRERERRDDRLQSLGRLGAAIAHEVRNPLNAIGLAVQRVERTRGAPADVTRLAGVILGEVERLNRMVEEVLRFARPRAARIEEMDAAKLLSGVATLVRPEAEARGVRVEVAGPAALPMRGDPDLLQGAVWNLLRNAIQASPSASTVSLVLARRGGRVAIEVRDRGAGVPAERRAAIFEPFQAQGGGLGLPIALSAAQAHGGTIEVEEAPGGGALFRLLLPIRGDEA